MGKGGCLRFHAPAWAAKGATWARGEYLPSTLQHMGKEGRRVGKGGFLPSTL